MSLNIIPHTFFPRSMFDMDSWLPQSSYSNTMLPFQSSIVPSMLDMFDPFDEVDRLMSRNLRWVDQPVGFLPPVDTLLPKEPHRHRISFDCAGFSPESIKTEVKDMNGKQQLCVWGLDESGASTGDDFSRKEFRKCFTLPPNAQVDKLVSFMAPDGKFIVDVPLQAPTSLPGQLSFLPQIVDMPEGGKSVKLALQIPENIDPSKVQVSVKDRDLIVKVEDKTETADAYSRVHIYNRTRLPDNTDFSALKCTHENNQLNISAPLRANQLGESGRQVPIEKSTPTPSIQQK